MIEVSLCDHAGTGLVFPAQTGVTYQHEGAGTANLHLRCEGFFVPFGNSIPHRGETLISLGVLLHRKLASAGNPYTWDDADRLDAMLEEYGNDGYFPFRFIETNREKLDESYEAWVHVRLTRGRDDMYPFSGVPLPTQAILTWNNSD